MNPNDYDEDGNNIVPCPICNDRNCPSKEDGKCPEEDAFVRDMSLKAEIGEQWQQILLEKGTKEGLGDISAVISTVSEIIDAAQAVTKKQTVKEERERILKEYHNCVGLEEVGKGMFLRVLNQPDV